MSEQNNNTNRKSIAKKSSIINLTSRIISLLLKFITRSVFIKKLGVDYLGLNSTLAQVLGALMVSELGIQSIIIYKLYKPLVENDKDQVNKVMSVYRSLYRIVSCTIGFGSIMVIPLLKYIITNVDISYNQIVLAWILMASSSSISYLMSYNSAIITADQKLYVITCVEAVINIISGIVNFVVLFYFKNYFVYLFVNLSSTLILNFMYLFLRIRFYPWMKLFKPSKSVFLNIVIDVKDGFWGKLSAYIFNSTDNIIISALIGTGLVAIYGNYSTVISSINLILAAIINPIQALIGNYLVNTKGKNLSKFVLNYTYTVYMLGTLLFVPTFVLINDFIVLFYGEQYQLNIVITILLAIDTYLAFSQISVGSMLDAAGMFREQKKFYFIGAIINIVFSIIGVFLIGLEGVLVGTIIGHFYYWHRRTYFNYSGIVHDTGKGKKEYLLYSLKLAILYACMILLLSLLFTLFNSIPSVKLFVLKGSISVIFVLLVHFLVFGRSSEFSYLMSILGVEKWLIQLKIK